MVPDDRKYTQEHEWIIIEGDTGTIGVTEFAATELGDVVFVELPEPGSMFNQGDAVGTVESVKAVADLYLPVSGEIIAVNELVVDRPELLNEDPLEEGWLLKIRLTHPAESADLLDARSYDDLLGG